MLFFSVPLKFDQRLANCLTKLSATNSAWDNVAMGLCLNDAFIVIYSCISRILDKQPPKNQSNLKYSKLSNTL